MNYVEVIHCGEHGSIDMEMDDMVIENWEACLREQSCPAAATVVPAIQNLILEWRANWWPNRPTYDTFQELHDGLCPTPAVSESLTSQGIHTARRNKEGKESTWVINAPAPAGTRP